MPELKTAYKVFEIVKDEANSANLIEKGRCVLRDLHTDSLHNKFFEEYKDAALWLMSQTQGTDLDYKYTILEVLKVVRNDS